MTKGSDQLRLVSDDEAVRGSVGYDLLPQKRSPSPLMRARPGPISSAPSMVITGLRQHDERDAYPPGQGLHPPRSRDASHALQVPARDELPQLADRRRNSRARVEPHHHPALDILLGGAFQILQSATDYWTVPQDGRRCLP